jgi:hypothetical protein
VSANIEITYGGTSIYTGDTSNTLTLPTSGKYMTGDIVIEPLVPKPTLENNTWSVISEVARAGEGGNYWSVGDTKSVALSGKVGTLSISTTLNVFIIGINHRNVNGITFQGFKTTDYGARDVCLVSNYGTNDSTGNLAYFTMNHWGNASASPYNTNYGGWKGCDLRYDILGSTNTAPSGYGSTPTTSRVGYDAGSATATSPKANTLMSCLPSDLRAVMQPMTIYTDNKGNKSNTAANVTTSADYLPLLAEFEIFGARKYANQYEQNNQAQYAYYSSGNSKIKFPQPGAGTSVYWWERSPYYGSATTFGAVNGGGTTTHANAMSSRGLAPAFMV